MTEAKKGTRDFDAALKDNEAAAMQLVTGTQKLLKAMVDNLDAATARSAQMEAQRIAKVQFYDDVLAKRGRRSRTLAQEEARLSKMSDVFDRASTLVPVVIHALAGEQVLPEPQGAEGDVVSPFIASLPEEQKRVLRDVLTSDQRSVIADIINGRHKYDAGRSRRAGRKRRAGRERRAGRKGR